MTPPTPGRLSIYAIATIETVTCSMQTTSVVGSGIVNGE